LCVDMCYGVLWIRVLYVYAFVVTCVVYMCMSCCMCDLYVFELCVVWRMKGCVVCVVRCGE